MADYTPSYRPFKDLGKFRFWVQKVIPLVYDDSLSYYELLAKVVNYLNITTANVENLNENFLAMKKFLEDYDITGYEQVIIDTLDQWAESGRLDEIFDDWSGVETIQRSYPKNVLDLGFDNTGANDISALFNQYTQEYALYFPAGTYLVSQPLYPKNDVVGAGNVRHWDKCSHDGCTDFVSGLNVTGEGTIPYGVFNITGNTLGIRMCDFNIRLNSFEYGICNTDDIQTGYLDVRHILISQVRSRGIYIENTNQVSPYSRYLYANDIVIFGAPFASSVGIYIGSNCNDIRLNNLEIMGCMRGLHFDGIIVRITSAHIWCGYLSRSQNPNDPWWNTTRCIYLQNSKLYASELYLDSGNRGIYLFYNSTAVLNSVFYWYDDTCNNTLAVLFMIQTNEEPRTPKLFVNGLTGYGAGYMKSLVESYSTAGPSRYVGEGGLIGSLSDCLIHDTGEFNGTTYSRFPITPFCKDTSYSLRYKTPVSGTFYEIARCTLSYGTISTINYVTSQGRSGEISVVNNTNRGNHIFVQHKDLGGNADIYYTIGATDSYTHKTLITIYERFKDEINENPPYYTNDITVDTKCRSCNWLLYGSVRSTAGGNKEYVTDVTTSDTGKRLAYPANELILSETNRQVNLDSNVWGAIRSYTYKILTVYFTFNAIDRKYADNKFSVDVPITQNLITHMGSNDGYNVVIPCASYYKTPGTTNVETMFTKFNLHLDTEKVSLGGMDIVLYANDGTKTLLEDDTHARIQNVMLH